MNSQQRDPSSPADTVGRAGVSPNEGPDRPTALPARSWLSTLRRAVTEFNRDAVTDRAAALTYYGVLSIFPGLLVLVAGLGLFGTGTTDQIQQTATSLAPGQVGQILDNAID